MHELHIDTAPEESLTGLMWVRNSSRKLLWEVLETEICVVLFECYRQKIIIIKKKGLSFEICRMVLPSLYFGHVAVLSFPTASDLSLSQPSSTSVMWLPDMFPTQTSCCAAGLSSYSTVLLSSLSPSPLRCHKWTWLVNAVLWSVLLRLHKLHFSCAACSESGW